MKTGTIEVEFFRMLNRIVEPMIRAGLGSPRFVPTGFVVLETVGRKSGVRRRNPLAATRIGGHIVVGTFRGNQSQWVRNLDAQPRTRYWLAGKPREARAFVMYSDKRFRVPSQDGVDGPQRSHSISKQGADRAHTERTPHGSNRRIRDRPRHVHRCGDTYQARFVHVRGETKIHLVSQ